MDIWNRLWSFPRRLTSHKPSHWWWHTRLGEGGSRRTIWQDRASTAQYVSFGTYMKWTNWGLESTPDHFRLGRGDLLDQDRLLQHGFLLVIRHNQQPLPRQLGHYSRQRLLYPNLFLHHWALQSPNTPGLRLECGIQEPRHDFRGTTSILTRFRKFEHC